MYTDDLSALAKIHFEYPDLGAKSVLQMAWIALPTCDALQMAQTRIARAAIARMLHFESLVGGLFLYGGPYFSMNASASPQSGIQNGHLMLRNLSASFDDSIFPMSLPT